MTGPATAAAATAHLLAVAEAIAAVAHQLPGGAATAGASALRLYPLALDRHSGQ